LQSTAAVVPPGCVLSRTVTLRSRSFPAFEIAPPRGAVPVLERHVAQRQDGGVDREEADAVDAAIYNLPTDGEGPVSAVREISASCAWNRRFGEAGPLAHFSRMSGVVAERNPEQAPPGRETAFQRAGLTSGWKRSFWLKAIVAATLTIAVVAALVVPSHTQVGYVLFALAVCGAALALAILVMTSLRSRREPDEQLGTSP
jgi:hypothetical protein